MSLPVDSVFQVSFTKRAGKYEILATHARFMVSCNEVRNLPEVISRLISKLDRV